MGRRRRRGEEHRRPRTVPSYLEALCHGCVWFLARDAEAVSLFRPRRLSRPSPTSAESRSRAVERPRRDREGDGRPKIEALECGRAGAAAGCLIRRPLECGSAGGDEGRRRGRGRGEEALRRQTLARQTRTGSHLSVRCIPRPLGGEEERWDLIAWFAGKAERNSHFPRERAERRRIDGRKGRWLEGCGEWCGLGERVSVECAACAIRFLRCPGGRRR